MSFRDRASVNGKGKSDLEKVQKGVVEIAIGMLWKGKEYKKNLRQKMN